MNLTNLFKKKQNKIVALNFLSTVLIEGMVFFTAPIFSKVLGTTNYGTVSLFNTWSNIVAIIFSLRTSSTLAVARKDFAEKEQSNYQSSVLFLSILSYAIFSLVTLLSMKSISILLRLDYTVIILILLSGFGQFCIAFANAKYIYEFKAGNNLVLSVLSTGGTILLSLIMVYQMPTGVNYYGRIIGKTLIDTILGIVICALILSKGRTYYRKEYWQYCVPIAIPFVFHMLSNLVLSQSDRLMIDWLSDRSIVGIYSFTYSFASVISIIYSALNKSWSPFFIEYYKNKQLKEMKHHAINYIDLFTIISMGFILLFPEVFRLYAPKDFLAGSSLIPIIVVGFYMQFLYSFPVNYEFYHRKTRFIAYITTSTAIINILLNYLLIIKFSALGAAIASSLSYFLEFVFHYLYAKSLKEDSYMFPITFFFKSFFMFISSLIIYFVFLKIPIVRWGYGFLLGIWILIKIIKRKAIF